MLGSTSRVRMRKCLGEHELIVDPAKRTILDFVSRVDVGVFVIGEGVDGREIGPGEGDGAGEDGDGHGSPRGKA